MSDATTYPIPRGWRRVTRGKTRWTDQVWNQVTKQFESCDWRNARIDEFTCVIRRVKGAR